MWDPLGLSNNWRKGPCSRLDNSLTEFCREDFEYHSREKWHVFSNVLYRFLTFLSIIHFCNILIFLCHNIMYNMYFKRLAINLPIYFCLNHIYLSYVHHLFLCLTQIIFVYQSISIHLKRNHFVLYFDDYKFVLWKEK